MSRRPSAALVLSVVALVAATVGTAAALPGHDSVRSNDIKNGQVKRNDLATDQRTVWALVDGSSGSIIRSSGGATVVHDDNGADYVNFHESLKGRAILATAQWDANPTFIDAVICGNGNTEETTPCDFGGTNSKVVYVETGGSDGNFYVAALPK